MERFIAILKTYKDFLQFLHWNNGKDYAKHILYERLMGDIDDILDRFVEVSMGAYDVTAISFEEFKNQKENVEDLISYIKYAKEQFGELASGSKESIQNVIIDIIEMFDRHLYLL